MGTRLSSIINLRSRSMKVNVEFLSLQLIAQALGKKKIDVDFRGDAFSELVADLAQRVKKFKEIVLEKGGKVAGVLGGSSRDKSA